MTATIEGEEDDDRAARFTWNDGDFEILKGDVNTLPPGHEDPAPLDIEEDDE